METEEKAETFSSRNSFLLPTPSPSKCTVLQNLEFIRIFSQIYIYLEKLRKKHEKCQISGVYRKIKLRKDHFRFIGYQKHSKAFRNSVGMQSCGIMLLD